MIKDDTEKYPYFKSHSVHRETVDFWLGNIQYLCNGFLSRMTLNRNVLDQRCYKVETSPRITFTSG